MSGFTNTLQRTDSWFLSRIGKLTSSAMEDAISFNKNGKSSQAREDLILNKAIERVTGISQDKDLSKIRVIQWGIENEPNAKMQVMVEYGIIGQDVSTVDHPDIDMFSCSPDWAVQGKPWEFKCPETKTHFRYAMDKNMPEMYMPQMACQCLCLGADSGTFISYDPRVPERYRLVKRQFEPSDSYLKEIEEKAKLFLSEVDKMTKQILESSWG